MDRNTVISIVGAVVTTVAAAEKDGGYAPKGVMYAALMGQGVTLDWFNSMLSTLRASGIVTFTSTTVSLTDKGRELAATVEAAYAAGKLPVQA